jgi:hypothetical protein
MTNITEVQKLEKKIVKWNKKGAIRKTYNNKI